MPESFVATAYPVKKLETILVRIISLEETMKKDSINPNQRTKAVLVI